MSSLAPADEADPTRQLAGQQQPRPRSREGKAASAGRVDRTGWMGVVKGPLVDARAYAGPCERITFALLGPRSSLPPSRPSFLQASKPACLNAHHRLISHSHVDLPQDQIHRTPPRRRSHLLAVDVSSPASCPFPGSKNVLTFARSLRALSLLLERSSIQASVSRQLPLVPSELSHSFLVLACLSLLAQASVLSVPSPLPRPSPVRSDN